MVQLQQLTRNPPTSFPSRVLVSHRDDVLRERQGAGAEADDAAAPAGLGHVDVVVRVGLEPRVVDLRTTKSCIPSTQANQPILVYT